MQNKNDEPSPNDNKFREGSVNKTNDKKGVSNRE